MRDLKDVFSRLSLDEGNKLSFGEATTTSKAEGGQLLDFGVLVETSWYKALVFVQDPISGLHDLCNDLRLLSDREKGLLIYQPMYGNFRIELKVNAQGNFPATCDFGLSEYAAGEIHDEFETYVAAIDEFRLGIEKMLKGIETS